MNFRIPAGGPGEAAPDFGNAGKAIERKLK